MSNEQKLREALQALADDYVLLLTNCFGAPHKKFAENSPVYKKAMKALATTEPEPTGMPELHPVAHIELGDDSHDVVTLEAAKAYGEQCRKAGYDLGKSRSE